MARELQVLLLHHDGRPELLDADCGCGPDCDQEICEFDEMYEDWCAEVTHWSELDGYPRELAVLRWGQVVYWPEDPGDKLLVAAVLSGMKVD